MNLLMTQYAVEGVTKENKKLRKKMAKQQEELAKQQEEFNNFRVEMAKLLEEMAKDMDKLRGRLEDEGCGPPIGDLSIGDLKQGGGVKTEAEFLNGHEFGSACGEIVNALMKQGTAEQGGGCERFHCVCGGNVKNEKRSIHAHNKQPMHTKYMSKKE
jgi:predicted nuclease with TOPRIM domain